MERVGGLGNAVLKTVAAGARRLNRFLEGIRKAQVMEEVARFRALKDPSASILDVYRFARHNSREMIQIANTPVTAEEIADAKWRIPPEYPTSVIADRVERTTLTAFEARKLRARQARAAAV